MDNITEVSNISDSDLDNHIQHLQGKLNRLYVSLDLAKAEKLRRSQRIVKKRLDSAKPDFSKERLVSAKSDFSNTDNSTKEIRIGSKVKILNKYRGNKGKLGEVVRISGKTATVRIPQEGSFVKYLSNLKVIADQHDQREE